MIARFTLAALLLTASVARGAPDAPPDPSRYFAIEVVDDQTGRGVPMVELKTTSAATYYTDSNGLVAFYEPGKLDPSVGINLQYFTGKDGFSRPMAPMPGEGVVWLGGLVVLPDEAGRDRMLGWFGRRRGLGAVLENGFVVYNDEKDVFEKLKSLPLNPPLFPTGYPSRVRDETRTDYFYFTAPYPALRVKADWNSYLDLTSYEGYTCLKPGTRFGGKDQARLDRDAEGKLVWGWKRDTPPHNPQEQQELIDAGKLRREESPFRLQD